MFKKPAVPPDPAPPSQPAFQPNELQRRLLHYIYEHPVNGTVDSMCHHAKVGRATYYRWCRDAGFRQWFATAWSARLIVDGTTLLNVARGNAHRSYPHWKALFDLTFSPNGLSLLHHWQETCAAVGPAAFDVPDLEPDPDDPAPAPSRVSHGSGPQPPSNQHPPSPGETKPAPLPVHLPLTSRVYRGPDVSSGRPLPHHLARLLLGVHRCNRRAAARRRLAPASKPSPS